MAHRAYVELDRAAYPSFNNCIQYGESDFSFLSRLCVAVRRRGKLLEQADPNEPFVVGDVVYLAGAVGSVKAAVDPLTCPLSSQAQAAADVELSA